jgi:hypothetical protein
VADSYKEGARDVICGTGSFLLVLPFSQDIKSHIQLAIQQKGNRFSLTMNLMLCFTSENIFGGILTFIIWD